ncbi:MAG: agmatinase [Desulfovibrio sp.]|nr:agmatinase [Desulfovibrio sp.]
MHDAFLASEYAPAAPEQAGFHIIPVPFEQSVSYGSGTSKGPQALLAASQQLEAWEEGLTPGEAGFYTAPCLDCSGTVETVLQRIARAVDKAVTCGAVPVLLGGEHTVTLGALRALAAQAQKKGKDFGVVHFDAHADLRAQYQGNAFSHACVMYHALVDLGLPLAQFAVRDFSPKEAETRAVYHVLHYDAAVLARDGLPTRPLPQAFPQHIYVSFDVDALDSSLMPSTGTPSPGGLHWHAACQLLEACLAGRHVVGLDVVELAPIPGLHHADFTAAKLCHLLMGLALKANTKDSAARQKPLE